MAYAREDLWARYRGTGDVAVRNALVEKYLPLARGAAMAMARRLPRSVTEEELLSDAVLGLVRAVEHYDPDCGTRFVTYASHRIRGAILDELRARDWVPRLTRHRARAAGAEDGLRRMIPFSRIEAERDRTGDDPALEYEDEDASGPFKLVEAGDDCAVLLAGLSARERATVTFYYAEDRSMREIGAALGICESRVSQILKGALAKMRHAAQRPDARGTAAITGA
jgi:RNA polymerase sigma factor for flagellar operon FliA